MRFVIDETSWNLDGLDPRRCVEALEEMLDCIDDVQAQGHGCCYSEDLFYLHIRDGLSFYELYRDDSPILIPPDVRIRIASAFNRLSKWQDVDLPWPESFDVAVAGAASELAPSIAWAYAQTRHNAADAIACITHPIRRETGKFEVSVSGTATSVWFVLTARDCERFFRWLIIESTTNSDEMEALSAFAFRGLDFVPKSFDGIGSMSKPYRVLVPAIVTHLAAFSDEGARIFSGAWNRASAEFGPFGVDISDENGNTKANATARAERTIIVNGEERIFWWHSKLERHQDRIHICPRKVADGGRILVGIFCDHLTV
jgi:hypothetical protein